ncbi:hypothetical protein D3H55_02895 [Bacillus salacetis]|uniref:Uncharacterized protein n=1 Tax=Bacillus salacetis TaxID=2315464 RepID=A0A3A1R5S1_9BACI|nr:hypothetical protein [Bacillus salacetis]RIW38499.1 hypothetical protein D3H55_02895 [Bacillus salacetis]
MMKIMGRILIILIVMGGIIFYIGNYTLIHSDSMNSVKIDRKEELEGRYFIYASDKKVEVKNNTLWNVLEEDTSYDIEYEWYGEKVPYITEIVLHGEGESINSGH